MPIMDFKKGRGVWYSDESYVTIIVESDTTYGTYGIEDGSLTIITTEEESDEYYGNSTILKNSKKQKFHKLIEMLLRLWS